MSAILIFKCTEGAGVGDYSSKGRGARKSLLIFLASPQTVPRPLSSFDTHARWQHTMQSARSWQSYGKIKDCEQSRVTSSWPVLKPQGRDNPYDGLYGEALPERCIFFRLQVYERVGILQVEVYKRVGKSVIWVCERDRKGKKINFMAL